MPSTAVMCCCSKVSGAGVGATGAAGELEVEGPATALPLTGAAGDAFATGCWVEGGA
jgi:hypothetical protein